MTDWKFLFALSCLALPISGTAAHAQPVTGPYVSLGAGTSILNPTKFDYRLNFLNVNNVFDANYVTGQTQFRPDYAGIAGAGYGFGNGVRVELDGDLIRNTAHSADLVDIINVPNTIYPSRFPVTGAEEKYGPMVNVLYDFSIGLPIYPYIGAGIGYQWVKFNRALTNGASAYTTGGTKGSFAYDIIGGLSYPLAAIPGLSLTAEYRFMQLTASRNYPVNEPPALNLDQFLSDHVGPESSHTFTLGLRYALFPPPTPAPAPAPIASPAPAAARTYLVFFDWDKYSLTDRAKSIIAQAAADSHTQSTTVIDVSGYTDTSGTYGYNMGLSKRRAKAVAAQLMADGVAASEISIHAYGETHLLVATGPGIREPQNRRVEIDLK